jgi:hypothetical protein
MMTSNDLTMATDVLRGYIYLAWAAALLAVSFLLHPRQTIEFVRTFDVELSL